MEGKEENRKPKQVDRVLAYLEQHGSITQMEAMTDLGIMRLGARIWEIQNDKGIPIHTEMVKVRNRHGEICRVAAYSLKTKEEEK